jgi:hypothetical protein
LAIVTLAVGLENPIETPTTNSILPGENIEINCGKERDFFFSRYSIIVK